ncbi:alpha/beta hydrolase [Grimontia sp. S25]|uniref:Alpha/beta hydrolase n=1 Tax=Grimontia sedimenti TaxID=2711294 RepID=A0A6M1RL79_9GAMM|nr:alpha/beta hydrolase [Grimontia sedimenti]NGN96887.1 alpha/beta hydrolase [Grimontia sedimenti]
MGITKKSLLSLTTIFGLMAVVGCAQLSPKSDLASKAIGQELAASQLAAAQASGLTKKTVDIKGYTAHFYEGGESNEPTLVLLHGLVDNKNSFVPAVSELTKKYHVVLPDLQAHGDNAQVNERDHSIEGQAAFIRDLVEKLGIKSLYIGGNSMGGHTAAAFAYRYQSMVKGLIVLNGTGVWLDKPSTYYPFPEEVDGPFMKEMWGSILINPPQLPDAAWNFLATDFQAKSPFYNQVVVQIENSLDFRLDEKLATVKVPALIIWGSEDKIVPLYHGKGYHAKLPNSEFKVLNAGHGPQLDIPDVVQDEIAQFLKKQSVL